MRSETLYTDPIWFKNLRMLIDRPSEIIPSRDQSDEERVNALVRLVLYCSLAVSLIRANAMYAVLGLAIIVIITLSYALGAKQKTKNEAYSNIQPKTLTREKKACYKSNPLNPFGNATVGALLDDEGKSPACGYDEPGVASQMRKNFNKGLFRNLDDVYEVENSQRQFYTMPVTTSAPDTIAFGEFLFGNKKTCKEDPSLCTPWNASRN
jgi:hypothetical protein